MHGGHVSSRKVAHINITCITSTEPILGSQEYLFLDFCIYLKSGLDFILVFSHIVRRFSSPTHMHIMHKRATGFQLPSSISKGIHFPLLIWEKIRSIRVMDVVRQVRRHRRRRGRRQRQRNEHLPEMLLSLPTKVDAAPPSVFINMK